MGAYLVIGKLPKDLVLGYMGLILAAIVGLGLYILVSSRFLRSSPRR